MKLTCLLVVWTSWGGVALAQSLASLSDVTRRFVSVDAPIVALTNVRVIDGTGAPAAPNRTVLISGGRIRAVGPAGQVTIPADAEVHDLRGHTVIPGLVGMHNHTFYINARGTSQERTSVLDLSAPRLYLANGVTTIRTTGTISPYAELNLKRAIDRGETPGPRMYVTGPYLDGPGAPSSSSYQPQTADDARRLVRYWAEEGVAWFKAYTTISASALGAAIDEAHRLGLKVTGHLCSVSFTQAVALGIDNLEHGFFTASDFETNKPPDVCPAGFISRLADVDLEGPTAAATIREIVNRGVALTSTLAAYEFLFMPNRPPLEDRVLDIMDPVVRQSFVDSWTAMNQRAAEFGQPDPPGREGEPEEWPFSRVFTKAQQFERMFVKAGGLLGAGTDPCCPVLPGFGDQRNFELLRESGFSPAEVVQIMSANGATVLGEGNRFGTISPGKLADLVVIDGDIVADPAAIRRVTIVFKEGVGYDPKKLLESVRGFVGLR